MSKFVLSIEGSAFVDSRTWTTHKILGAYDSEDEALEAITDVLPDDLPGDKHVLLLTELCEPQRRRQLGAVGLLTHTRPHTGARR